MLKVHTLWCLFSCCLLSGLFPMVCHNLYYLQSINQSIGQYITNVRVGINDMWGLKRIMLSRSSNQWLVITQEWVNTTVDSLSRSPLSFNKQKLCSYVQYLTANPKIQTKGNERLQATTRSQQYRPDQAP